MKLVIISLGGRSSRMISKEAKKYFNKVDLLDIRDMEVHIDHKEINILYKGNKLEKYDCIYIRGSYKYTMLQRSITAALYEEIYTPFKPETFTLAHNKFLTLLRLQKHNVNVPQTYLVATVDSAKKLLEKVNYPIIFKIPYGTHGKGVTFADSLASAKSILDTLEISKQPYIIQEYIESGATDIVDIRAIVIGNKVVAAMKRVATPEEHRANIHMGGKGIAYELDYDTEQLAVKAAKAIGADICAIDILEGAKPSVLEINLSPGLKGITEATKKNVADKIAKFLFEKTKEFEEIKKSKGYEKIIKEIELTKGEGKKEIITNLDIKAGIIKLPKIITDITDFTSDDEIVITAVKGKVEIKKHKIEKK